MNITMIALDSLVGSSFIAYIFTKWAHISNLKTGLQAGAIIGLFLALYFNFYYNAMKAIADVIWQTLRIKVVINNVDKALS